MGQVEIEEVQGIINELEGVSTERIKAETRLEKELEVLEELGCSSIEEAQETLKKLDTKIDKRDAALKEEFEDFMDDYGSLF